MLVHRYGVHRTDGGVAFLLQDGKSQNAISPDLPCPVQRVVRMGRPSPCPHKIDLSDWETPPDWVEDPLAKVFLPTTDPGIYLLNDYSRKTDNLLSPLPRLCSAIRAIVYPIDGTNSTSVQIHSTTNVGPLVWIGLRPSNTNIILRHMDYHVAAGRRCLLIADQPIPLIDRRINIITTDLGDISREPLERIGAGALRQEMRA